MFRVHQIQFQPRRRPRTTYVSLQCSPNPISVRSGGKGTEAVAPERILKLGNMSGAMRRNIFLSCPSTFFGSTSTISHFGERFRDVPPVSNHL